ncbi:hypothetical protein A0J48_012880 [Sphaerospermopsis aphanizomenoides BCCUSP55]|uniref:hypothetical protein n=1 Tax=Sphaerospermopsis aphanizomenoides TaxID=459663 RepID=UPI001906B199|nr:hypothetical protein [Sphaerospermopsis aphanizomenoides]MBK1988421.1 hypothetical protein [Sphaerospermopsis aphanizomenoides BCCUSP55]
MSLETPKRYLHEWSQCIGLLTLCHLTCDSFFRWDVTDFFYLTQRRKGAKGGVKSFVAFLETDEFL